MLNLEHQTVYDIIRALAGESDVYKVVEADEIIQKLPSGMQFSKVQLSLIIRNLREREYIDVKYFTPEEYCLLVTKRVDDSVVPVAIQQETEENGGERIAYDEAKKIAKEKKKENVGVSMTKILLMAFFGAFFGSALVTTIAILIIKFMK